MIESERVEGVVEGVVENVTSAMAHVIEKELIRDDPTEIHRGMVQSAYDQFQKKTLDVLPDAARYFVDWLEESLKTLKEEAEQARERQQRYYVKLQEMKNIAKRFAQPHGQGDPPDQGGPPGQPGAQPKPLTTDDLIPISQDIADMVKEVVQGNKALKEEMKEELNVSMEVKKTDLVQLLLRSVKVTVKKGGKKVIDNVRISDAKTIDEKELMARLEQARANSEQLKKVGGCHWQENQ